MREEVGEADRRRINIYQNTLHYILENNDLTFVFSSK
jgi:hypothetical protein